MSGIEVDPLREQLEASVGKPLGAARPTLAPDEVNLPMIRHWVDALEDHNPLYLDARFAAGTRFGGIVAPPAMLQTWTMPRPVIKGIAERGGAPGEIDPQSPLALLARAGYTGTLATDSELEFERYLRPGDRLSSSVVLETVSARKSTRLGVGYFVTWLTTYRDDKGEAVGRQRFRIFKFKPAAGGEAGS